MMMLLVWRHNAVIIYDLMAPKYNKLTTGCKIARRSGWHQLIIRLEAIGVGRILELGAYLTVRLRFGGRYGIVGFNVPLNTL